MKFCKNTEVLWTQNSHFPLKVHIDFPGQKYEPFNFLQTAKKQKNPLYAILAFQLTTLFVLQKRQITWWIYSPFQCIQYFRKGNIKIFESYYLNYYLNYSKFYFLCVGCGHNSKFCPAKAATKFPHKLCALVYKILYLWFGQQCYSGQVSRLTSFRVWAYKL